jgi:hypothetical protein
LVYADDVNLLGDKMDNIKKNAKIVNDASEENAEKSKYMILSCRQNAGQNNDTDSLKMWHSSNIWE